MELRSQSKVSGSQTRPRATSEGRTQLETDRLDDPITTLVNSPSSPTGIARGGKTPSRTLPIEGGPFRASSPNPRSESAGGAGGSPDGDPPRRRGQTRESGDAGGRSASSHEPELVVVESGKPFRLSDEGNREFTGVCSGTERPNTSNVCIWAMCLLFDAARPIQQANRQTKRMFSWHEKCWL